MLENKQAKWINILYWHGSVLPGMENFGHNTIIKDTPENRMAIIDQAMALTYGVMFKKFSKTDDNVIVVWLDKYKFGQR